MLNALNEEGPDVIIAEFGGDIIEANIPTFFEHPELNEAVKAIIHSSGDILGMSGSMEYYEAWGLRSRPIYLTYPIGRNDAGSKNRIEAELNLPVFNPMKENETSEIGDDLLARIEGLGTEPENTD